MKNFTTPSGLLIRAAILVLLYTIAQLLGLRSYTSLLTGMMPTAGGHLGLAACLAVTYIILYLLAVVVAPILTISAALLALWNRCSPTESLPL